MCPKDRPEDRADLLSKTPFLATDGLDAKRDTSLLASSNLSQVRPLNGLLVREQLGEPSFQQTLRCTILLAQELHIRYT